jgi:outer membrane protein OmpA-like peptidoglycan-associated protein
MKLMLNCLVAASMCVAFSVNPVRAVETDGRWAIGIQPGVYKLVLTDHSDIWTPGYLINADIKYGLSPNFSLGVEGSWMRTYLADLSEGSKREDGAGASFDKISDGPMQKAFIAGLLGEYRFNEDGTWSPYLGIGTGLYLWKWTDSGGSTLMSDDPALDNPDAGASGTPDVDLAGNPYELKDQELYVMGSGGIEYYASDLISIGLGVKFRYLTHVLTDFTDDKDIVGGDPGQLDLPKGILEGLLGLTFHFGGGCPDASASASGSPGTGAVPLDVQFNGTVTGGCPEYTYAWDFGDGTTSAEQNPRHTYESEGNYTATLTVTDSKGTPATSSVTTTASCPPLEAMASANPPSGNAPLTVKFSASAMGGCPPFTYAWDFGDGTTSAEQNPSHTYETEGNITPSLTVTDAKGTTSKKSTPPIAATSALVPKGEAIVLEGVNFQTSKAVLLKESEVVLDRVAEVLKAHPEVKVEVGGHSDSDGKESANLNLSTKRANSVRDYLLKKGVPADQMTAKGYGESQPIADNKTPEGKAKNRRVELKRTE